MRQNPIGESGEGVDNGDLFGAQGRGEGSELGRVGADGVAFEDGVGEVVGVVFEGGDGGGGQGLLEGDEGGFGGVGFDGGEGGGEDGAVFGELGGGLVGEVRMGGEGGGAYEGGFGWVEFEA